MEKAKKTCIREDHDESSSVSYFHGNVCNVCHAKEVRERRKYNQKKYETAKQWFENVCHANCKGGTIGFCRLPRSQEFSSYDTFQSAQNMAYLRRKEYRRQKRQMQRQSMKTGTESLNETQQQQLSTTNFSEDTTLVNSTADDTFKPMSNKKTMASRKMKYSTANQWYDSVVNKTSFDGKTIGNCRRPISEEFHSEYEFEQAKKIRLCHQQKYRIARRTLKRELNADKKQEDTQSGIVEQECEKKGDKQQKCKSAPPVSKKLSDSFLVMPFSLLEASSNAWQVRKRYWNSMFDSLKGRSQNLLKMSQTCQKNWSGTSRFDPVLCEVIYSWYCPRPQLIQGRPVIVLDPFAGGCVRGIVASKMGLQYIGIDTNAEQIRENNNNYDALSEKGTYKPVWIHGDSCELSKHFRDALCSLNLPTETMADFIFTCPPYYNLEIYSADEKDISNLPTYQDFLMKYQQILNQCEFLLKKHHLCVFVVSNFRDGKTGEQIPFHIDTQNIFLKFFKLHQDIVLSREKAGAAFRARMITSAGSKLANTHQNICIFSNDVFAPRHAREHCIRAAEEEVQKKLAIHDS